MKLSSTDLYLLCQCAISAAYQAGQYILKQSHHPVSIKSKKAGTSLASQVVTEVDQLSQEIILQTLRPSCERYDLALLTEESPDNLQRLQKDYFWCIDPLDGTLPYIESTPGYAVSIALVSRDSTALIGVIYDPTKQTLYHAINSSGAYKNGKPWTLKLDSTAHNQTLTFICDRSFKQHPLFSKTITELESVAHTLGYAGLKTILFGGAAMNACWVLENSPACYFKFPKLQNGGGSLWDYAATACLFHELGVIACDIHGQPLDLNRPDSTFMNLQGVLYSSDDMIAKHIIDLYKKIN